MKKEKWLPIAGYEGFYSVSNLGRIRSEKRSCDSGNGRKRKVVERVRALSCHSAHGYPQVSLSKIGGDKTFLVHLLVLRAFKGPAPSGMECAHLDGNRRNCALHNLAWKTPSSNDLDKDYHGTRPVGDKCSWAKLTDAEIVSIRKDGRTQKEIASSYGVNQGTISRIISGKRRHIRLRSS